MADVSEVFIVGRLAYDPDKRALPSGTTVTKLVIPTHRQYEYNGQKVEETTWHRVSAFGGLGDTCADWLKKGSLVRVRGRLAPDKDTGNPRVWEKDGEYRSSYDITAEKIDFLADFNTRDEVNRGGYGDFEEPEW